MPCVSIGDEVLIPKWWWWQHFFSYFSFWRPKNLEDLWWSALCLNWWWSADPKIMMVAALLFLFLSLKTPKSPSFNTPPLWCTVKPHWERVRPFWLTCSAPRTTFAEGLITHCHSNLLSSVSKSMVWSMTQVPGIKFSKIYRGWKTSASMHLMRMIHWGTRCRFVPSFVLSLTCLWSNWR